MPSPCQLPARAGTYARGPKNRHQFVLATSVALLCRTLQIAARCAHMLWYALDLRLLQTLVRIQSHCLRSPCKPRVVDFIQLIGEFAASLGESRKPSGSVA